MKYRPEIDGLRALAVVPVILFHAGFQGFSGGFVGVDIFFVISGYLITSIIIKELDRGSFSLVEFYERRARRILPALFFVLSACLPFAWLWLRQADLLEFGQSLVAVATFASNIFFWINSDYFATVSELKPLLHTWSLAVEEQYYIAFPLFMMALWLTAKRKAILGLVVIAIGSFILSEYLSQSAPSTNFYLLPSRAWELLLGSFTAFYLYHHSHSANLYVNQFLSISGLLLIVASIVFFNKETPFPGRFALAPTLGTCLIILYTTPGTFIYSVLSNRALVSVGLISYSAYLWHQPLFALVRHRLYGELPVVHALVFCIITFLLAYISWRWVEKPFRDKHKTSRTQIFIFSLIGLFATAAIGFATHHSDGYPQRKIAHIEVLQQHLDNFQLERYQLDNKKLQQQSWQILREISSDPGYAVVDNRFDKRAWSVGSKANEHLLIVGNSHAKDMFNVLYNAKSIASRFALSRYGIQIEGIGDAFYASPNYQRANLVLFASKYSDNDLKLLPAVLERLIRDGKRVVLVEQIHSFADSETGEYNLADLVLIERGKEHHKAQEFILAVNSAYTDDFNSRRYNSAEEAINNKLHQLAKSLKQVSVLDRLKYVCPEDLCIAMSSDGTKLFYDYGHHTIAGAEFYGNVIDKYKLYSEVFWPKRLE